MEFLSTDDKIDVWQILEQRRAARLGHASEKTENDVRPFFGDATEHSHFADRLLVGHVTHAAGVEQNDVGLVFVLHPFVAANDERVGNLFRIALVHLAAVGFNEELRHGRAKSYTAARDWPFPDYALFNLSIFRI